MAHIKHKDTLVLTLLMALTRSFDLLARLREEIDDHHRRKGSASQAKEAFLTVLKLVFSLLGDISAKFLHISASQSREYMADAGSVIYSRNPAALASALEKISKYSDFNGSYLPKSVQALLTVAPKDEKTHPPLDKRIEILKCLDSGIGLNAQNYAEAYESVLGTKISFNDQPAT
jgi:heat shock protein HtpX